MNEQSKTNWSSPTSVGITVESQPLLPDFTERFINELKMQFETVNRIQNKLHTILDKTVPEKDSTDPEPNLFDTASKLRYLQGKLETNSMMLERIFNHLSAIV